jgi:hypothetical protein
MRCSTCYGELVLTSVVPDETAGLRGCEHHTFICSSCHATERRFVFTRHGREAAGVTVPSQAARGWRSTWSAPEERVEAPGLLGRVVARLRGH